MQNRARGVIATKIPAETFAAFAAVGVQMEEVWLIDRGEGEGARYAIINTEGVTHAPKDGLFRVLNAWRDAEYAVSVDRIVEAAKNGAQEDLADVVRTFGDRLESNFSLARRWALRETA